MQILGALQHPLFKKGKFLGVLKSDFKILYFHTAIYSKTNHFLSFFAAMCVFMPETKKVGHLFSRRTTVIQSLAAMLFFKLDCCGDAFSW